MAEWVECKISDIGTVVGELLLQRKKLKIMKVEISLG